MVRIVAMLLVGIGLWMVSVAAAAEPPRVIAAGDWSKPVADTRGCAISGRLILCEIEGDGGLRETPLFVELRDASDAIVPTLRLYCEMGKSDFRVEYKGGLTCELRDREGRPVEAASLAFGGAVPQSQWISLPSQASIRLRASPFGVRRPGAMALTPHLGAHWVIEDGDMSEYFLAGSFTIDPADDNPSPQGEHVWRGTIELPALRIVNAGTKAPIEK